MDTLVVCPNSLVAVTLPPDALQGTSFNGWDFTSKPNIPYRRKFKVTLHGLTWFLNADGSFDTTTTTRNNSNNARALEVFYEQHGVWTPFLWTHPHLGQLTVRFAAPVTIEAGMENSGGFVPATDINLIHHNPAFS